MFASLAAPAAQVHRPARGDVLGPVAAASIGSSSHASVGMGL